MIIRFGKRVLIVEDEGKIARLLATALEDAGYAAHIEPYGCQALEYAAANPVDCVILDLLLPDVDGFDVCKALRKMPQCAATRILILTALERPIHQLRGLACGADGYLTKPFNVREVVETVHQLLTDQAPHANI